MPEPSEDLRMYILRKNTHNARERENSGATHRHAFFKQIVLAALWTTLTHELKKPLKNCTPQQNKKYISKDQYCPLQNMKLVSFLEHQKSTTQKIHTRCTYKCKFTCALRGCINFVTPKSVVLVLFRFLIHVPFFYSDRNKIKTQPYAQTAPNRCLFLSTKQRV